MKVSQAIVVHDLYSWLPGYGESKVSFHSSGGDLVIEVEYERQAGGATCKRQITFRFAAYYCKSLYPGMDLIQIAWDQEKIDFGSLVEFRNSEVARQAEQTWRELSGSVTAPRFQHFFVRFMSENVSFHVIAEAVNVSDEMFV